MRREWSVEHTHCFSACSQSAVLLAGVRAPPTRGRSPHGPRCTTGTHRARGGACVCVCVPLFQTHGTRHTQWASTPSSSSVTPPSPEWRVAASWRTMGGRRSSCAVREVFRGEDDARRQKTWGVAFPLRRQRLWQNYAPRTWLCMRSHRVYTPVGAVVGAGGHADRMGGLACFQRPFFSLPLPLTHPSTSQNPGLLRRCSRPLPPRPLHGGGARSRRPRRHRDAVCARRPCFRRPRRLPPRLGPASRHQGAVGCVPAAPGTGAAPRCGGGGAPRRRRWGCVGAPPPAAAPAGGGGAECGLYLVRTATPAPRSGCGGGGDARGGAAPPAHKTDQTHAAAPGARARGARAGAPGAGARVSGARARGAGARARRARRRGRGCRTLPPPPPNASPPASPSSASTSWPSPPTPST